MEWINKGQKKEENRKSSLEHHLNNYSIQYRTINAKVTGQKAWGEMVYLYSLIASPSRYLLITKGSKFTVKKPQRCHIIQVIKMNIAIFTDWRKLNKKWQLNVI